MVCICFRTNTKEVELRPSCCQEQKKRSDAKATCDGWTRDISLPGIQGALRRPDTWNNFLVSGLKAKCVSDSDVYWDGPSRLVSVMISGETKHIHVAEIFHKIIVAQLVKTSPTSFSQQPTNGPYRAPYDSIWDLRSSRRWRRYVGLLGCNAVRTSALKRETACSLKTLVYT
jgi:hypothetical protein